VTQTRTKFTYPRAPLLRAWRRSCFYRENKVVSEVSLDVSRGEIVALIGPSGCGKTTFLRSLNRLLELTDGARTDGTVTLSGLDIRKYDAETLRRRVGYVFQLPNPFPLSIYDNVALPLLEHGIVRKRADCKPTVEEVLERVGLLRETGGRLEGSALRLSGGQQQRLCIARLLAVRPDVVLLDEPCSALDPRSTATIERELLDLKEEVGIVIVTHNLAQARRVADRVGFFLHGSLVELGPADDVFERPADQRTADYLAGVFG
jgi:phosphate transport system ATP-binding protein